MIRKTLSLLPLALFGCHDTPTQPPPSPNPTAAASQPATRPSLDPREPLADLVQLTFTFARAGESYFSHDMKWIIFQASSGPEVPYQMYVAPLLWKNHSITGLGHPIRISPTPSRNTCGYFSPDGQSIIFASTAGKEDPARPTGGYQVAGRNYRWDFPDTMEIFRYDNWQPKLTENPTADFVNLAAKPITNNTVYDAEGSFSPDNKYICFTHGAGKEADIYIMRADGSNPIRITSAEGYDGGPFFSPDGKRLVYRSDRKGNDLLQVFVADLTFDAAGNITGISAEHQLTNDANVNWGPTWHPDGKHLIYATSAHGHANYELYFMRDDGAEKTRITHAAGADVLPVFSPDGKWLMWTSKRSANNTSQIFVARFLSK